MPRCGILISPQPASLPTTNTAARARARVEDAVELRAERVVVDRRRVRLDLRPVLAPPRLLRLAQPLEPLLAAACARALDGVGEDPEHRGRVAHDRGVWRA